MQMSTGPFHANLMQFTTTAKLNSSFVEEGESTGTKSEEKAEPLRSSGGLAEREEEESTPCFFYWDLMWSFPVCHHSFPVAISILSFSLFWCTSVLYSQ